VCKINIVLEQTTVRINSGIYEIMCVTSKLYVGQTRHSLKQRYQEHMRYIQQNNLQSTYALHILNNKYEYRPINNTVFFLKQVNKGPLLIPFEQLYI